MPAKLKIALFYHSLISDWNHGNAHFLRGFATELLERGHQLIIAEPRSGWSYGHLIREHGEAPIREFRKAYPQLNSLFYDDDGSPQAEKGFERFLDEILEGVDLVLVHEWNSPAVVRAIGERRKKSARFRALFHDTHHRMVSDPNFVARKHLANYDGVLCYGRALSELYLQAQLASQVWTWHEAADIRVFKPEKTAENRRGLVWVGNWGDDERRESLQEFLIRPAQQAGIPTTVFGVRYPEEAKQAFASAGIQYQGWLPNFKVPALFAHHALTIHIPRAPYLYSLRGIPTIRVFEALACGIPLICAPWEDTEGLFKPGRDFLLAHNSREMRESMRTVLQEPELAASLIENGLKTILDRHTCAHRVSELLGIYHELSGSDPSVEAQEIPSQPWGDTK
jgi:spore maturation protein CgeB